MALPAVSEWRSLDEQTLLSRHYVRSTLAVEMSPENIPKKVSQTSTKVLYECAKSDGLARSEYEFILGHQIPFAGNKDDVICVLNGELPSLSKDELQLFGGLTEDALRCTMYEVMIAATSDGVYSDIERQKIHAFAKTIGVSKEILDTSEALGLEAMVHRRDVRLFTDVPDVKEDYEQGVSAWAELDGISIIKKLYTRNFWGAELSIEPASKEITILSTKILRECAKRDGLHQLEYEWILGHQTMLYGNRQDVIDTLDGKNGGLTDGDISLWREMNGHASGAVKRILYECVLAVSSDFVYGEVEKERIREIAEKLGAPPAGMAQAELLGMSKFVHNMKVQKFMGEMPEKLQSSL